MRVMHQCYYCEQLFESKERLYDHLEVHSDTDRGKGVEGKKKKTTTKGTKTK